MKLLFKQKKIVYYVLVCLMIATLSFGLISCKDKQGDVTVELSDTLIIGTNTTITSLNRLDAASGAAGYNFDVLSGTISQMAPVAVDTNGVFKGLLCDYSSSTDGIDWTFTVKNGYKWHDGTDVTASDIAFTLKTNLSEDSYDSITENATENSTTIKLKEANPRFLNNVVVMRTMPKHILEGKTVETLTDAESVIGCGPFKFVKYDTNAGTVEFEKFEQYPSVDSITFNKVIFKIFGTEDVMHLALATGDIDTEWNYSKSIGATYEELLKNDETITLENYAAVKNPMCLFFNNQTVNLKVRQGISKAIDYSKLRRLFGTSMTTASKAGFAPMAVFGSIETAELSRDLDAAKALLAEAGYSSTNKYEFELLARSDNASGEVAKILKTDLEETGMITVTVVAKEAQTYLAQVKAKEFTAHLGAVTAFGMNNQGGLGSMYMPTTSAMPYANIAMENSDGTKSEYAIIHNALSSAKSEEEYKQAAKDYQEYFVENVPAISLYNDSIITAHSAKVTGFVADGTFGFLNIKQFETLKKVK